ncbi:nucleotide sugar dehydrogenase [Spirochaeta lutea]|uniref:UDP-N-acetyl-D-glucosamine dehydrogenase n=1 Tax=Spirochaeta lutea TaxID=1480694 RepID=A0A098QUQ3_9SPIO|nr:nucleotide sugar dehydrogenase [Spirochaeta lutea]KGE71133.1 UDP-N-acetyl-D-glucosamine dehydrogenase [Spirochaeta lutea]
MSTHEGFLTKIANNSVKIGVLGLGYVGLPLAVTFAKKGIEVLGFEKSVKKAQDAAAGRNYISDVTDEDLLLVVQNKTFSATTDFSRLNECDAIFICVPTPLDRFRKPDMRYIEGACEEIGRNMKKGTFIALESTTYPTTTEDFMLPIIERESGLTHGTDFWLAYSPERVDPGNTTFKTENTPKVLGAMTAEGQEIGMALYKKAINQVFPVSSPKVAEMVKILENTYRLVNISLINELALLSGKMGINIWEVIDAAKTKPYGFQAFYPGPGIGGHCIPLDPFYLEYIAKKFDFDLTMIHTAGHIDMLMPHRMTIKITSALNRQKKSVNGSRILFVGVAYKPNIADERESPALKIMQEVANKGGLVEFFDPHVYEAVTEDGTQYTSKPALDDVSIYDCVVITTKHSSVDFETVREQAKLIVDLQNVYEDGTDRIYKL